MKKQIPCKDTQMATCGFCGKPRTLNPEQRQKQTERQQLRREEIRRMENNEGPALTPAEVKAKQKTNKAAYAKRRRAGKKIERAKLSNEELAELVVKEKAQKVAARDKRLAALNDEEQAALLLREKTAQRGYAATRIAKVKALPDAERAILVAKVKEYATKRTAKDKKKEAATSILSMNEARLANRGVKSSYNLSDLDDLLQMGNITREPLDWEEEFNRVNEDDLPRNM
jgi:hypothetical protein